MGGLLLRIKVISNRALITALALAYVELARLFSIRR